MFMFVNDLRIKSLSRLSENNHGVELAVRFFVFLSFLELKKTLFYNLILRLKCGFI